MITCDKKKKTFNSEIISFLCLSMHILWDNMIVATSVDLTSIRYARINQLPYAEAPTVYALFIHIARAWL